MSERPLLFLDVDGVINAVPQIGTDLAVECLPTFRAEGFPINVPAIVPGLMSRLADVYEIVWATAWRGAAHPSFAAALGVDGPSWVYVDWVEYKLPEIVRYAGPRRWAWVDDDADWELRALGWTRDRHVPDALILVPDPSIGLTADHAERLLEFARG